MKSATIYDIAKRAGVSPMAVSIALRPPSPKLRLGQHTRQRVQKIARRINYHPNHCARGLSLRKTFNVGVYINRIEYFELMSLSWRRLIKALQSRLWQHGYRLGFYFFEPGQDEGFEDFLVPHRFVDGIVVQGRTLSPAEIAQIHASGIPSVSLYENLDGFHSLTIDEFATGQAAAEYLYQCGHRQAAVLAHPTNVERWEGRLRGFFQRASELGLETPASAQFYSDTPDIVGSERLVGRRLFEQFHRAATRIRCLYVPSDYLAFGVLEAMDEAGVCLGREISLLSYDNVEGHGLTPWGQPRLTSFDPPHDALGKKAAEIFVHQPSATSPSPVQLSYAATLVERGAVKKIACPNV